MNSKHQLPESLDENDRWIAFLEIVHIDQTHVEVTILLREKKTGLISPTDTKFMREGDTIVIEPWQAPPLFTLDPPEAQYYTLQSKNYVNHRYAARFQYNYNNGLYDVSIPGHPTKGNWIADDKFYESFYLLNQETTLEDYERAVSEYNE